MRRNRSSSGHPAANADSQHARPLRSSRGLVRLATTLAGSLLAIALWGAPAAQAAGCTGDAWTNTAGGSWTTGSDWSKKAPPTSTEAACITEPGTYTVTISQANEGVEKLTLGATSGKQTLVVESTAAGTAELHTASGATIGATGALTLTQNGIVANTDTLSGGAIVNEGTITTLAGAAGGERRLETPITNTGTVAIDTATLIQNGSAAFTNEGALTLGESVLLKIPSATLTDGSGGSISAATGASVVLGNSATYVQGAGTTSGGAPVIAEASNVDYTGGGASVVHERGYYGHLSGNIAHGQTFVAEGCVGAAPSIVFVAKAFENAGTIDFTSSKYNGSDCGGNDRTQFKIESGALTNTGTINVEPGIGGERDIEGSVTNQGTVNVAATTNDNTGGTTFTNEGTVNLEGAARFNFQSSTTFANLSGSLNAGETAALFLGNSATYVQGAGTTSGGAPVIAEASNVDYTGGGASVVHERGYYGHLSGNIAHGQTFVAEGCVGAAPSIVFVAKAFENAGTIDFTSSKYNGSDCGGNDRTHSRSNRGRSRTPARSTSNPVSVGNETSKVRSPTRGP